MENEMNITEFDNELNQLLRLELPIMDGMTIGEIIEQRAMEESFDKLGTENYRRRISELRPGDLNKYIARNPLHGENLMNEVLNMTHDISSDEYHAALNGDTEELSRGITTRIVEATESVRQNYKRSITSQNIRDMLFNELLEKIKGDYHQLVWQLL